ncbi:MAG: hypothetical protein K8T20_09130 [Planctomycetes bacterium]|nr:hypothetical protein [Planctomycetota bacterium]
MTTETTLDRIRRRWTSWVGAGRTRDGFFRLVTRGFDDVLEACGGKCWERIDTKPGDVLFIDRDFSIQWYRDSIPDFARLVEAVGSLGALAPDAVLQCAEGDETWTYALALIAEKSLAWLAQSQPGRAELLVALARVKALLHKTEEAADLHAEGRKAWDKGAKGKRTRVGRAAM